MANFRLLIGMFLIGFASHVFALSKCIPDQVKEVFARSSTVVAATAENVSTADSGETLYVVWRVNASWKGGYIPGSELTTRSNASWPISKGQSMLLYLNGKDPHQLKLEGCSRSGLLQDRLRDVHDLYEIVEHRDNGT